MKSKSKAPAVMFLRCVYHTRVVVTAPSGTRYVFDPDEEQPVNLADVEYLLAQNKIGGGGCCGGSPTTIAYFEEAY